MSPKPAAALLRNTPDANALQSRASDPANSVWVGASAGTGKTKVLTDRVLRLLLPQSDGRPGTPPYKILCLTFTKAGAGEMALRLSKTLTKWAVMSEEELLKELCDLIGHPPNAEEKNAARTLFTRVIDTPGGLKIMTIHSFCQSVLGRFPLEAGLSPNFHVLEETTANEYREQARLHVLRNAKAASPLAGALNRIARTINEEQFFSLLSNIIAERGQLDKILKQYFGPEGLYEFLCKNYKIEKTEDPESLKIPALLDKAFDKDALTFAAQKMKNSESSKNIERAAFIEEFLTTPQEERSKIYGRYKRGFFTDKGKGHIFETLAFGKIIKAHPEILDALKREAERLQALDETTKAAYMALLTRDLLMLCEAILKEYQRLKLRAGGLDFDDLILRTLALLKGESMNLDAKSSALWVQHKLDEGLEHILIDEAQDTNPEQWEIIKALCDDFFTGLGASATERTVFTVGDEKQSIYSFQRASPKAFHRMHEYFEQKVKQSGKLLDLVPMQKSFRSAESILRLVDSVFANDAFKQGLGNTAIEHFAHREGQQGIAELWPVFPTDKPEDINLWNYEQAESEENEAGSVKLARHVAGTIEKWLKNGEKLPSHDRPIRPGDILILVRTRSKIVRQISRALKDLKIPVSGLDRIILNEQLVILDLLACGEFVLQPRDDLTLACLLKSPLIGMSEEGLFELCAERGEKNIWDVLETKNPEIFEYLGRLLSFSHSAGPFAFFSHILQTQCPADPSSGRKAFYARLGIDAMEALDVFLSGALDYERNQTPSLQKFLHTQKHSQNEIKREQESGMDVVRIMTVHGSKGLQAPIVILPDTASTFKSGAPRADKRLLWPTQTELPVPLWSPTKDMDGALFKDAMDTLNATLEEEYRRLFYVALTRAEDRIYIAAATGKNTNKLQPNCWYKMAEAGFNAASGVETLEDGTLRITNPQKEKPDRLPKAGPKEAAKTPPPAWLSEKPKQEPSNRAILRPSFIDEKAASPLEEQNTRRFLRGNLTHKLLQYLPDIAPERRQSAGEAYLSRYGAELAPEARTLVLGETLKILNSPDYAELFGPLSMAEVPITGRIEGLGLVSGQIDRIVIGNEEILIVDYKTNRPPPETPEGIPQPYREQMRLYADVLRQIYPSKPVHCFLLWTDGCILMPVDGTP